MSSDIKEILKVNLGDDYSEGIGMLVDAITAIKKDGFLDIEDTIMLSSIIFRYTETEEDD